MTPRGFGDDVAMLAATVDERVAGHERPIVAISGPPGSGKSTLAAELARQLAKRGRTVSVVPMDGFHLDNAVLEARGHLPRKGAPFTFDAEGYRALIARIRDNPAAEIAAPLFDRTLDLARAGATVVAPGPSIVLTEGNYLLLDDEPWRQLAGLFDLTVSVEADFAKLSSRLVRRWLDHGHDLDAARKRAGENDIPNAETVVARSRPGDIVWTT